MYTFIGERRLRVILLIAAFLVVGSATGFGIGKVFQLLRQERAIAAERQWGKEYQEARGKPVSIGMQLSDWTFEDLDRRPVKLSAVVRHRSLVSVVQTSCGSCIGELVQISNLIKDTTEFRYFIFVTNENPRFLEDVKDSVRVPFLYLYDHRKAWSSQFEFQIYPFNIIVDHNLVIIDIIMGGMLDREIEELIKANKETRTPRL